MKYGSVCSGIEAASVAWHPLGWRAAFLSEIESFPRAVLTHHYPDVPLHGDFTTIEAGQYDAIDLLVGGTPCQSFSVAGLRKGMADPRGNLALVYLAIVDQFRPEWLVWENVPGVLSSSGGRDFGAFLGGLAELGYEFAYRVLDAQYFGVPQRRRRVFVVGCAGGLTNRAAAVLFERACLRGDPAPSREAGARVAAALARGADSGGKGGYAGRRQEDNVNVVIAMDCQRGGPDDNAAQAGHLVAYAPDISRPLCSPRPGAGGAYRSDLEVETFVAHSLRADGFDASEDGTGRGTPIVPVSYTLRRDPGMVASERTGVRRLTPRECERLQGFPDDWTLVPYRGSLAKDSPRYKAIGNSMAVPVMRWLGQRIALVDAIA